MERRRVFEIVLIVILILGALELFHFYLIQEDKLKLVQLGSLGIMAVFIPIEYIYNRENRISPTFSIPIIFILISVFLSMLMAFQAHAQPIKITLIAQRTMYFYLFYYFLHALRIKPKDLLLIVVIFGVLIMILYVVQYVAYPFEIFKIRITEERGSLRIFFPGQSFVFLTFFYSMIRFFDEYKSSWLILTFLAFTMMVFLATRLVLANAAFCTAVFFLTSNKVKSKLAVIPVLIVVMLVVFFVFEDRFLQLLQLSEQQGQNWTEDARVKAVVFFMTEFFPNALTYILGNGMDSLNAAYGVEVDNIRLIYGYYQSDIGIIGDYTKYGIIFVFAAWSIYYRAMRTKYSDKYQFLFYYMLFITILMPMSGDFANVSLFVPAIICLYIIDVMKHDMKYEQLAKKEQEQAKEINAPI